MDCMCRVRTHNIQQMNMYLMKQVGESNFGKVRKHGEGLKLSFVCQPSLGRFCRSQLKYTPGALSSFGIRRVHACCKICFFRIYDTAPIGGIVESQHLMHPDRFDSERSLPLMRPIAGICELIAPDACRSPGYAPDCGDIGNRCI